MYAFGKKENAVVSPYAHVTEGSVACYLSSHLVWASSCVGKMNGVLALAEAVEQGVAYV